MSKTNIKLRYEGIDYEVWLRFKDPAIQLDRTAVQWLEDAQKKIAQEFDKMENDRQAYRDYMKTCGYE